MTEEIDMERLGAYVDGELDDAEARKVEDAIARSPSLRETVRSLRELNGMVRAATSGSMRAPVPERLLDAIDDGFEARAAGRSLPPYIPGARGPWTHAGLALAASVVVLVVGAASGYLSAEFRIDGEIARLERARAADRDAMDQAVHRALEQEVSGTEVGWENPDSGSHGTVTPVRTYRSAAGKWCREYTLVVIRDDGGSETRRAVACRESEGAWIKRAELFLDS